VADTRVAEGTDSMVEELEVGHTSGLEGMKVDWDANAPVQSVRKDEKRIHIHHQEEVRAQVQVQGDHLVHRAHDVLPKACQRCSQRLHSLMSPRVVVWH
jgi:hypothetical protein